MEKKTTAPKGKAEFVTPIAEPIPTVTESIMKESIESGKGGGFAGSWDEDISLPKIGF